MNITRVGVDIAKSIFHVYAVDQNDNLVWQAKLTRCKWLGEICKRVPEGAEVGIEACASAHHWGREQRWLAEDNDDRSIITNINE